MYMVPDSPLRRLRSLRRHRLFPDRTALFDTDSLALPGAGTWLSRLVAAVLAGGVLAFGFAQGSMRIVFALPELLGAASVAFLQAEFALVNFTVFLLASTAALAIQLLRRDLPEDPPWTGPDVTAIVPVYRDAAVLDRSVESLLASEYDDLRVVVVCEPDDEASIDRARTLEARHDRVDCLVNTETPGSKAAAVNYAASVTESEHIAVFDADEVVDPAFVPTAVAGLRDADVVQGRTVPEPDGVVETAAYYESVVLGELTDRLVSLVTGFRLAASHAVVMRRSAFETAGGYDPEMLTEDYDFAFRCYEAGLSVREQFAHPSRVTAARTPRDWWGQRKRWLTGYAQVLHRRLGALEASRRSVFALAICAGSVLGNLLILSMAAKVAVLVAVDAAAWIAAPLAALAVVGIAARWYDARAGHIEGFDLGWALTPAVLVCYSLVGIVATVEYVTTWDGEWYSVDKTG